MHMSASHADIKTYSFQTLLAFYLSNIKKLRFCLEVVVSKINLFSILLCFALLIVIVKVIFEAVPVIIFIFAFIGGWLLSKDNHFFV